jgi:lysophospholipase L1-like esterase
MNFQTQVLFMFAIVASAALAPSLAMGQVTCSSTTQSQAAKLALATEAAPKAATSAPFVGTWSSAITTVSIDDIEGQTLRELVESSVGGTSARIKLSNLYGNSSITFAAVHFAKSTGFDQLTTVAGTDHQLTFAGASSVTLKPGCEVVSDAAAMTVTPLTEYAVSMFFSSAPASGGVTSGLSDPRDGTNVSDTFIFAGDVSAETNPAASLVGPLSAYYFLTGVDVQSTTAAGTVVAIGASITQGRHTTGEAPNRWTDLLAQRLNQAGINVGVENMGIAGNNMLTNQLANNSGDSMLDRFSHDVLEQSSVKAVIISDDAINDLASNTVTPTLGTQLIDAYQTLISQAHASKLAVICSTLTPYGAFQVATGGTDEEPVREQINTFLTGSGSGCDAIFDQAKAVQDPSDVVDLLPAFNQFPDPASNPPDGLHPNDAGHKAIASAFNLGIFTSTGVPPITPSTTPGELLPGQGLTPGHSLVSQDGRFTLTLETNGSLNLFMGKTVLWTQPATSTPPTGLIFQGDGNLVEYGSKGTVLWQSNSTGAQGDVFFAQNDGNMVIYNQSGQPIFASNTCCH